MVNLRSGADYFDPPAEPQFPRMREAKETGKLPQWGGMDPRTAP
jgi:hypothetical protein